MGLIYLVRHGETDWNEDGLFRGRENLALNEKGLKQAAALASFFEFREISAVYSSPLVRARQTAEVIARKKGLPVQIDEDFIDVDYGDWQGLKLGEIKEKFPFLYKQWLENPENFTFPGGDSVQQVSKRTSKALICLAKKHRKDEIVVVAHQAVNKIILQYFFQLRNRLWEIPQEVAAINLITFDGKDLSLEYCNYRGHLARNLI